MSDDTGQEKTEEPTPKKLEQAREKGQVARSRELNTMLVLLSAVLCALLFGTVIGDSLLELISSLLILNREEIFDTSYMILNFISAINTALLIIAPFFFVMFIACFFGPVSMGGINFSVSSIMFKWEKIDPIKGLSRIFAWRGLVELVKALSKFVIIACIALLFLYLHIDELIALGAIPLTDGILNSIELILWAFFTISAGLIIVAIVDVPFQLWDHKQNIKMTRQEVKDDNKDSEGNPEVRGHIRQLQREMAQRRMMEDVPKADVVITNPEHYSVALKYDQNSSKAPVVLAKGVDLVAFRIRTIAKQHKVMLLEAAPLARSIYFTTEINEEIPAGLYLAVAQILAYVYQLKRKSNTTGNHVKQPDVTIPPDLQFN